MFVLHSLQKRTNEEVALAKVLNIYCYYVVVNVKYCSKYFNIFHKTKNLNVKFLFNDTALKKGVHPNTAIKYFAPAAVIYRNSKSPI